MLALSSDCQCLSLPHGCGAPKPYAEQEGKCCKQPDFPCGQCASLCHWQPEFPGFGQQPFQGNVSQILLHFLLRPSERPSSVARPGSCGKPYCCITTHSLSVFAVCSLPPEPENGGYICHPRPCRDPLNAGSVIEYLCAEGYMLKGDYKYLTCKNGEWKPAMEISCRLNEGQSGSWERGAAGVLLPLSWWEVVPTSSRAPVPWGSVAPLMPRGFPSFEISCLCKRHLGLLVRVPLCCS